MANQYVRNSKSTIVIQSKPKLRIVEKFWVKEELQV